MISPHAVLEQAVEARAPWKCVCARVTWDSSLAVRPELREGACEDMACAVGWAPGVYALVG